MNFEFKSTFKIPKLLRPRDLRSLFNPWFVLAFNLSSLAILLFMYLQNHFIPAVYGSKSTGDAWITTFELLAFLWTISTAYVSFMLFLRIPGAKRLLFLTEAGLKALHTSINNSIRMTLIQYLIVITILKNVSNHEFILMKLYSIDKSNPLLK